MYFQTRPILRPLVKPIIPVSRNISVGPRVAPTYVPRVTVTPKTSTKSTSMAKSYRTRSRSAGLARRSNPMPTIKSYITKYGPDILDTLAIRNPSMRSFINAGRSIYHMIKGYTPNPSGLKSRMSAMNPVRIVGTGITNSKFRSGNRLSAKSPFARFLAGTCQKITTHTAETASIVSSTVNRNQVEDFFCLRGTTDMTSAIAGGFLGTGSIDNSADTAMISGQQPVQSLYTTRTRGTLSLTSRSEANIIVKIYELVANQDTPSSVGNQYYPVILWRNGLDALGDGNNSDYHDPGMSPTRSPYFNEYWTIEKSYQINLKAGASHVHTFEYNPNCAVLQYRAGINYTLAHLTRATMVVVQGTPVHDATTNTIVGLGFAGVDAVYDLYTDYYISNKGVTVYYDLSTYGSVATPQIVGDIDTEMEQATT